MSFSPVGTYFRVRLTSFELTPARKVKSMSYLPGARPGSNTATNFAIASPCFVYVFCVNGFKPDCDISEKPGV